VLPIGTLRAAHNRPYVTYGLIALNTLVFLYTAFISDAELNNVYMTFGAIPARILQNPLDPGSLLSLFTNMFLHGGWLHFIGNMFYLWAFGPNVEDHFGKPLFLGSYLLAGLGAVLGHTIIHPTSIRPLIGASGAIAGVMACYLLLYPGVKVRTYIPLFFIFGFKRDIAALFVIGFWFILQIFSGALSLGADASIGGGVAFFGHIGGFVAGFLLTFVHMARIPPPRVSVLGD